MALYIVPVSHECWSLIVLLLHLPTVTCQDACSEKRFSDMMSLLYILPLNENYSALMKKKII